MQSGFSSVHLQCNFFLSVCVHVRACVHACSYHAVYPSLVSDSEIRQNQSRKSSDGDDDLWMPHGERKRRVTWEHRLLPPRKLHRISHFPLVLPPPPTCLHSSGPVKLIKGSIASSPRKKRNARKRSFEQSLSATAAKISKIEQESQEEEEEEEEELEVCRH